ncbi:MAG: iron chelate uptake ABC transporter family permease subunit, partial [Bacteroidota bacterium]
MKYFLVALLLLVLFLLELFLGSANLGVDEVFEILGKGSESPLFPIVSTRMLRAGTAIVAGAGLGLSGLGMQTFFRNPLAGPSVLGITSGASLGVAILTLIGGAIGWGYHQYGIGAHLFMALAAMLGAGIVLVILLVVGIRIKSSVSLLVFGLMVGYITGSLVSVLQLRS